MKNTNALLPGESSCEEQFLDSLEDMTIQDSGISEESSEVSTVSVSEEIKRFQEEITKACEENEQYQTWKQQRAGQNHDIPPNIPPRGVGSILVPKLPARKKSFPKRVSYAKNEVTVLGTLDEINTQVSVNKDTERSVLSSRQIDPSLYTAPADPPVTDNEDLTDTDDDTADEEKEDIPVLPSVKQLANKFQILEPYKTQPALTTKQVRITGGIKKYLRVLMIQERVEKVAAMLRVNKPAGGYSQVSNNTNDTEIITYIILLDRCTVSQLAQCRVSFVRA